MRASIEEKMMWIGDPRPMQLIVMLIVMLSRREQSRSELVGAMRVCAFATQD